MYVQLSSKSTFIYKFIFTGGWVGMAGLMTLSNFVGMPASEKILFLIPFWIAAPVIWWTLGRLKKVERQGDILRISNYFHEIEVPLSEVKSVSGGIMMNPDLIWVTFSRPTVFGSKIVFIPTVRLFTFWRHPLVSQLREEIAELKARDKGDMVPGK